ncbi:DUF7210 family protein [Paraburkholderia terrae]|uniref:DUF7210 domain-containing protein n=1 Tax=Paraburkholderia terrae TaxID=311230 RepID=A0A2I8ETX3_9BURK|nr:hypothetical protein [Paraburkholderia terrae]AUT62888.1 hypothetical protein C2L65_25280 [Paraburkholderia terrae]
MKVKAKRALSYGNRHYATGDEIEMSERDAKLLSATGRVALPAANAPASQKRAGDAPATRKARRKADAPEAPTAADAQADDAQKSTKKTRSGYKRRDMRATDDAGDTGDE